MQHQQQNGGIQPDHVQVQDQQQDQQQVLEHTQQKAGEAIVSEAKDASVVPAGFEGPEKILEIDFNPSMGKSLREVNRETWDAILDLARCQILSKMSNEFLDAYVLSESSLFVYSHKVFIKTCGTTTLLRCLPLLLKVAESRGLELQWIGYTRKNFIFPDDQEFPHSSFAQEIEYTKKCRGPQGGALNGGAYILGDLLADHWYVYVADYCGDANQSSERNVNIMMYDLDIDVCQGFYRQPELDLEADAQRAAYEVAKINDLCGPDAIVDDRMFEPCGYSLNALQDESFYTLHVTPEPEYSYASFETNLEISDYTDLLTKTLRAFRPKRFAITMFADEAALEKIRQCPTQLTSVAAGCTYRRETQSTTSIRADYACRMSVYVMENQTSSS
ncbi:S-adenosylmethionine decarboxylase proenzyme [Hondaea fermentalgiana]|uniref:S-adenosylmethionine decarboxylase proenzyme n=1 Tax=Hondaea fermentalgiana TaxID=2315210 RepID=A0A2R5GFL0_9STRA|nr:S-adenosylmethionine decarboxylase proenzyme [Hondaea fermentalgiana]|eukprot:GBG29355.1 S-adenosylmethionine decarboxylase proenzyme [Hondaea fermentalgiana]